MEFGMNMFIPITKFDEEQRMVYGIATCSKLDNQNEIVDWDATKSAVADYSNWRNIREMHKPSAVGTAPVLELRDNTQELYVGAKIIDDSAWMKCKEGVYKGFSIGGDKLDQKVEMDKVSGKTVNRITKYNLNEISLVDRPANPICRFQTVKRDTSVHVITISEDPLKNEAARVMEKSLVIAKRVLSKEELEKLQDSDFGRITITMDGDTIIKTRDYPMPDATHAINMIRKSHGDPISDIDKERVHQTAMLVLGKKHVDTECPYCVGQKLKGGAVVEKTLEKAGSVKITHEPNRKTVEVIDGESPDKADLKPAEDSLKEKPATENVAVAPTKAPAETQKQSIADEDAGTGADAKVASGGEAGVEEKGEVEEKPEGESVEGMLKRVLELLEGALGGNEEEEAVGYEEEAPATAETVAEAEEKPEVAAEAEEEEVEEKPEIKVEEDDCSKSAKTNTVNKLQKALLSKSLKAIIEPLAKENKELKARLEKIEKQPLPRKEAKVGDKAVKVEKYQDVKLEKKESDFSDELKKDIDKAKDLRMSKGANLNKEEDAFCQRVASQMLAEKLSK